MYERCMSRNCKLKHYCYLLLIVVLIRVCSKVRGILRRWVKALYGRVLYRGLLERDEIRKKAAAAAVLQGQWR